MADTRVQSEVEDWVRKEWLPKKLGQAFFRERLPLRSGGVFDFDAVSADHTIAMTISTSTSRTRSGNNAIGKMNKLRADMLFLTMATVAKRYMVLTDKGMHDQCMKDRVAGRVPPEIEFLLVDLPAHLAAKLAAAQKVASAEVSPGAVRLRQDEVEADAELDA